MLAVASALSSACQYLSDKAGATMGASQSSSASSSSSSLASKKRKHGDDDGDKNCYSDNLVHLCHCVCRIASKSVQVYMSKYSQANSHQQFKGVGIEQLRSIFNRLLHVSEKHPSSWLILSSLVSCIADIASACKENPHVVVAIKDAVPQKAIILLKANSSKSSAVSCQGQQDGRSDEQTLTLVRLWSISSSSSSSSS